MLSKTTYLYLIWKDPDAGKDWGQEEKGTIEDEMVGWHRRLDGHKFGWTPGVGDGQGGLVCRSPWGRKESDLTERLNWVELISHYVICLTTMQSFFSLVLIFCSSWIFCISFHFCLFLAMPHSMWNLSSRDQPLPHAVEAQSPNHWTTREVPLAVLSKTSTRFAFPGISKRVCISCWRQRGPNGFPTWMAGDACSAVVLAVAMGLLTFALCLFQVAFSYVTFSDPMKWKLTSACWSPSPWANGSGWWNACAASKSKRTMSERKPFRSGRGSSRSGSTGKTRRFALVLQTWYRMPSSTMMTKKVTTRQSFSDVVFRVCCLLFLAEKCEIELLLNMRGFLLAAWNIQGKKQLSSVNIGKGPKSLGKDEKRQNFSKIVMC